MLKLNKKKKKSRHYRKELILTIRCTHNNKQKCVKWPKVIVKKNKKNTKENPKPIINQNPEKGTNWEKTKKKKKNWEYLTKQ